MGARTVAGFPDQMPGRVVAFDETGETLLVAVDGMGGTFTLVRARADEEPVEVALVKMMAGPMTCVGSSVLVCSSELGVVDWQTGKSVIVKTAKGHSLGTGAIAPRGDWFAGVYDVGPGTVLGSRRYEVRLFERGGAMRWKAEAPWMMFVRGLAFSPDGATLFSLEGEHPGAGALLGRWDVGSGKAQTLAIAAGGEFLATPDGYVLLRPFTSTVAVYPPSFCADPHSAPLLTATEGRPEGFLANAQYRAMAMSIDRRELFVSSSTRRDTCLVHRLPLEGQASELKLPVGPRSFAVGARVVAVTGFGGKDYRVRLAALDAEPATKAKPSPKASGGDKSTKKPAAAAPAAFARLHEVLALAEAFYAKLDGDDVRDEPLAPMTPAQIAKIEQAAGVSVPDEVKAFWLRGFKQKRLGVEAPEFGTAGIDFLGAPHVVRNTKAMRELEVDEDEDEDEDDVMARLHREGVALSHSEPHFVVDCGKETRGAIYRVLYDGTPLDVPVASSLTEFLEHWLAAGCFTSHDYPSVWKRVKDHVPPLAIPAKANKWLRFYDRQYKTTFAR